MGGAVYMISCEYDERVYVGSSFCAPEKRRREHFGNLRRDEHPSLFLQKLYNVYGPDAFTFKVVEVVADDAFVRAREQCWLIRNDHRLLNASKDAWNNDRTGAKMSPEWVATLALKMKGNQYRKGKPHSDAGKKKISDGLKKAIREGRRKQPHPDFSRANIAGWNEKIRRGEVKAANPGKPERNAKLISYHQKSKSTAETARHFGLTISSVYYIIDRYAPQQLNRRRRLKCTLS